LAVAVSCRTTFPRWYRRRKSHPGKDRLTASSILPAAHIAAHRRQRQSQPPESGSRLPFLPVPCNGDKAYMRIQSGGLLIPPDVKAHFHIPHRIAPAFPEPAPEHAGHTHHPVDFSGVRVIFSPTP